MNSSPVPLASLSRLATPTDLARRRVRHFPNESSAYREARTALLADEIELRRMTERVAARRRDLPLGGEVPENYAFEGEDGPAQLSDLFGDKHTLVVYNWMFNPARVRPCPICTSLLSALDGEMPDILQRVAFAVVSRSPISKMGAFKRERGWRHLSLYSSGGNRYNVDYADEPLQATPDQDNAAFNVFVKQGEGVAATIHHFWGDEMGPETADPGQDPRGAVNAMPLWHILDLLPGGRGDWTPKLTYSR